MVKKVKATKEISKDIATKEFDVILDFGPAYEVEAKKEIIENAIKETFTTVTVEKTKLPWYKKLAQSVKNWFKR